MSVLKRTLQLFDNIATREQLAVFAAALVTTQWTGPSGARPCFAFLGPSASGKSCAIRLLGRLAGGVTYIGMQEAMQARIANLPDWSRVVCIDNPKLGQPSPALEHLITCEEVSGPKPYKGHVSRPNRFMYTFASHPELKINADLARRCYFILLKQPRLCREWDAALFHLHGQLLPDLKAECSELLWSRPRAVTVPEHEAFGTWFSEVLAPVAAHPELQELFHIRDPFDLAAANFHIRQAVGQ